jgi:anti-anti-sigma factor
MLCNRSNASVSAFSCTPFVADVREAEGTTEVSLCGEIDLANAAEIEALLLRACAGPNRVVNVDLGAVTLIDACGLRSCLDAQRQAREEGRDLVFSAPQGIVARVIRVLELESVLLGATSDE